MAPFSPDGDARRYFLGLPARAFPGWKDRYFTDTPSRLGNYATVFNTVEGNTAFYRIPDRNTVLRRRDAIADTDFRFCFKLPREVTHHARPDLRALDRFLDVIDLLDGHLGPLLVQFPAGVGPAKLPNFEPVFGALIRLILHPDITSNRQYIDEWATRVAGYLDTDVDTYMMIHCPNNLHCPRLAREFHEALRRQAGPELAPMPAWPVPQQDSLPF